jgi:hypothetical protein
VCSLAQLCEPLADFSGACLGDRTLDGLFAKGRTAATGNPLLKGLDDGMVHESPRMAQRLSEMTPHPSGNSGCSAYADDTAGDRSCLCAESRCTWSSLPTMGQYWLGPQILDDMQRHRRSALSNP